MITRWALDSYLDLRRHGVFDRDLYFGVLRRDILRLRQLATDSQFKDPKF